MRLQASRARGALCGAPRRRGTGTKGTIAGRLVTVRAAARQTERPVSAPGWPALRPASPGLLLPAEPFVRTLPAGPLTPCCPPPTWPPGLGTLARPLRGGGGSGPRGPAGARREEGPRGRAPPALPARLLRAGLSGARGSGARGSAPSHRRPRAGVRHARPSLSGNNEKPEPRGRRRGPEGARAACFKANGADIKT